MVQGAGGMKRRGVPGGGRRCLCAATRQVRCNACRHRKLVLTQVPGGSRPRQVFPLVGATDITWTPGRGLPHLNPPGWLARRYSMRLDTAVVCVRSRFFSASASFQL